MFKEEILFEILTEDVKIGECYYDMKNLVKPHDYELSLKVHDASNYMFAFINCEIKFIPSFYKYYQGLEAQNERNIAKYNLLNSNLIQIMDTLNGNYILLSLFLIFRAV